MTTLQQRYTTGARKTLWKGDKIEHLVKVIYRGSALICMYSETGFFNLVAVQAGVPGEKYPSASGPPS